MSKMRTIYKKALKKKALDKFVRLDGFESYEKAMKQFKRQGTTETAFYNIKDIEAAIEGTIDIMLELSLL
ncbi:MAG: hypothetical protein ACYCS1_05060 [Gammaproteobacteria bacterium]